MPTHVSTIVVKSTLQKVWDALTLPQLVKQWQYGAELITDWNPGNEIRFRAEWEGKVFEQWGKVLEFTPGKQLKYSLFAPNPGLEDKPENYFVMGYNVEDIGNGQVKIQIIQEDNRPNSMQHDDSSDEENPVLKSLKNLVES